MGGRIHGPVRDGVGVASGEDPGSRSGGGVETAAPGGHVREHARGFREGDGMVEINQFGDGTKAAGEQSGCRGGLAPPLGKTREKRVMSRPSTTLFT